MKTFILLCLAVAFTNALHTRRHYTLHRRHPEERRENNERREFFLRDSIGEERELRIEDRGLDVDKRAWDPSLMVRVTKLTDQMLLDWHNSARSRIAAGEQEAPHGGKQPPAADMRALEWDTELVKLAQKWADVCSTDPHHMHDTVWDRHIRPWWTTGQDFAATAKQEIDNKIMSAWMGESLHYDYASNKQPADTRPEDMTIGHYTQLAWAETYKMGCALKQCGNGFKTKEPLAHIVCDFTPGGNWAPRGRGGDERQVQPYISGPACSKCPEGAGFCLGGLLCASPAMCQGVNFEGCTCPQQKRCENGGIWNAQKCECDCAPGYFGRFGTCDEKCEDDAELNRYDNYCADYADGSKGHRCNWDKSVTSEQNWKDNFVANYEYFTTNCRKSCNRCDNWLGTVDTVRRTGGLVTRLGQHVNGQAQIAYYREAGKPESEKNDVRCVNVDENCGYWKMQGACQSSNPVTKAEMLELCPNICRACKRPPASGVYETPADFGVNEFEEKADTCVDKNPGRCAKYSDRCSDPRIKDNCPKTCGTC